MKRSEALIQKTEGFQLSAKTCQKNVYPKANGKTRPLGIPSFDDKLVQEVVRMILESIYEPTFHVTSHGFRPKRSCHTALQYIKRNYTGSNGLLRVISKGVLIMLTIMCWCRYCAGALRMSISSA